MEKENLVLLHSFPTNSILLSGLIEYLSDYFNVYFIDLPGFIKTEPPLKKVSFQGYYDFVEEKIKSFHLDHYLVGGISFGFAVVNNLDLNDHCKGIIAIEPFITARSLKVTPVSRFVMRWGLQLISSLKLYRLFWGSEFFKNLLPKLRHYPPETMNVMIEQIDGRTFFDTANMLFKDHSQYKFHKVPYALIANQDDRTVDYPYLYEVLSKNVEKLLVINTKIDHYPKDTSKAYFQKMVPLEVFEKLRDFFAKEEREAVKA